MATLIIDRFDGKKHYEQAYTLATDDVAGKTVLNTLLFNIVSNPVKALIDANYIGILAWAIALGLALRHASHSTKLLIKELSHAVSGIVKAVIRCAPLGIFGLVAATLAESGFSALLGYAHLLAVLLGCMLFVAVVVNPLIVYVKMRDTKHHSHIKED